MSLAVEIVQAVATTGAVAVALYAGHRSQSIARQSLQVDGRREAAVGIAQWVQSAETGILAWHDPQSWHVRAGAKYGPETGIRESDIVPPSQGRMAPSVEMAIRRFDEIRGVARFSFGPRHEVSRLVEEVIAAIQQIAHRGVIYAAEDGPTPRDYVDLTFRPLVADLYEALGESCELRESEERHQRSGLSASDNRPQVAAG